MNSILWKMNTKNRSQEGALNVKAVSRGQNFDNRKKK